MNNACDIAIIGGGAAGLAAAIFAAETRPGLRVCVLDGAKTLGAKILVSGGGRCNVTNQLVIPGDYNGPQTVVRNVLAAFDHRRTVQWFADLGVPLKTEETGKLFPTTDSARTVLTALLDRCHHLNIQILPNHRVIAIDVPSSSSSFLLHPSSLSAKRLILSTGGRSLPKTGSDGAGYALARALGHTVTDTWPALVPLVLADSFFHADVTGLSVDAELTTLVTGGKRLDRRRGSLLFTHFGISGPLAMDASRHYLHAAALTGKPPSLLCNFFPGETADDVERRLIKLVEARNKATVASALSTFFPQRLAEALARFAGIADATTMSQLPKLQRRHLATSLVAMSLPVVRDRGWNYAEVTAGGVPMAEVDFRTMASRKCPNLHLAGEILDVDGRIGGFNFQWAWATAHLAGRAAALSLT